MEKSIKVQLAKSPCYPPYAVVVGEKELWDCDCASDSIERTLELAAAQYPGVEVLGFDDSRHYSQRCLA